MAVSIGIDVGSVAVKVVVMRDEAPATWVEEPTRPDIAGQCDALLERVMGGPDCTDRPSVCATGYGRKLVSFADGAVTEIMANAAGAGWLYRHWRALPGMLGEAPSPLELGDPFRTIIDVGGQDSKVIVFGADGMVRDFAMNDRCAAGTGRFLEVMARVLEVDLVRLSELALHSDRPAVISSACTVFAESEVVSRLAEGDTREDIAAGVFRSVADQVAGLAARCTWRPPVLFDGGPSRSPALRRALADDLGCEPAVTPLGQFTTALGAAVLATQGVFTPG